MSDILKIFVPSNYEPERSWIIKTLFDFLNIQYCIEYSDLNGNYVLEYNEKRIVIADCFFSLYGNLNYIHADHLPCKLDWLDTGITEDKLAIIYGRNEFSISEHEIFCGLDIFASSFYMLSRWEEIVLPKDRFGRCDERFMWVVKNGIYKRPIVNEYIEFLRMMLVKTGVPVLGNDRKFTAFITHDIDDLFRYASIKNLFKNLLGDLLHRKSIFIFGQTCLKYLNYKLKKERDPFDTFDELMDLSDQYGLINAFYFKPSYSGEHDTTYDIRDTNVINIISNIHKRGHEVGIHPSKNTFHDSEQFGIEVERLRSLGIEVRGGRQHYLLYDVAETFGFWEKAELVYDAGLGFSERAGFRCGICYEYSMFDPVRRKKLTLVQRPLIVMEVSLMVDDKSPVELFTHITALIDTVKKYNGEFVFLWHNDHFKRHEKFKYAFVYKKVIEYFNKIDSGFMQGSRI